MLELDSMILMGPFQVEIFCSSLFCFILCKELKYFVRIEVEVNCGKTERSFSQKPRYTA